MVGHDARFVQSSQAGNRFLLPHEQSESACTAVVIVIVISKQCNNLTQKSEIQSINTIQIVALAAAAVVKNSWWNRKS